MIVYKMWTELEWMSVEEYARVARVSVNSVYRAIQCWQLSTCGIYRGKRRIYATKQDGEWHIPVRVHKERKVYGNDIYEHIVSVHPFPSRTAYEEYIRRRDNLLEFL